MLDMTIIDADPQGADAMALLREAAVEARSLYPESIGPDAPWPTNGPTPPGGCYLLAYHGRAAVGSAAIRPLGGKVAEVRRMFVTRSARRRGIAARLLHELERRARRLGYDVLRLETGCRQAPAIRLYESLGYVRIEAFGEYADDPTSVCFEKPLGRGDGGARCLA